MERVDVGGLLLCVEQGVTTGRVLDPVLFSKQVNDLRTYRLGYPTEHVVGRIDGRRTKREHL